MARKSFIENEGLSKDGHCIKRVRIRSYSGPHFSRIRTEYGETSPNAGKCGKNAYLSVFSPNAEKWGKNADQNNSEYRHFLRNVPFKGFADLKITLGKGLSIQRLKFPFLRTKKKINGTILRFNAIKSLTQFSKNIHFICEMFFRSR